VAGKQTAVTQVSKESMNLLLVDKKRCLYIVNTMTGDYFIQQI